MLGQSSWQGETKEGLTHTSMHHRLCISSMGAADGACVVSGLVGEVVRL